MTRGPRMLLALVAALLTVPATRAWDQCVMCQSVVSQSPEAQAMAAQLNLAILVLFVAPYVVLGATALLVFREPLRRFLTRAAGRPLPR